MIGANNYGFAAIVERCVINWITSPSWWKNYCSDDSDMTSRFTAARQATETDEREGRAARVRQAMTNAGYSDSQYTIIGQTYWSPIPRGSGFRYPESGWTRQSIGGCGTWNRDADWANDTVVNADEQHDEERRRASRASPTRKVLDLQDSLNGPPPVREHGRAARGEGHALVDEPRRGRPDRVGRADPHDVDDRAARTSSRRTATPATGASSRCATACAWPTTAARCAAASACGWPTGSTRRGAADGPAVVTEELRNRCTRALIRNPNRLRLLACTSPSMSTFPPSPTIPGRWSQIRRGSGSTVDRHCIRMTCARSMAYR